MKVQDINIGVKLNGFKHIFVKKRLSPWKKYNRFLSDSQWWSKGDLLDYQQQAFKRLIERVYEHVPYYRGAMQIFNVKPDDIRSLQDLSLMPFVEKEMVRRNPGQFLSTKSFAPVLYKCHTSGTTGTPLTLYRDLRNIGFEYAMLSRQRQWAGLSEGDRYATLKGELLPVRSLAAKKFCAWNGAENKLVMSSYHISAQTFREYVHALTRYKVVALDGYPSSIYALAAFMLDRGMVLPMKAILTSSETLVPEHKKIIEQAFACRVFDYYGMAERIAAIHTCEHGSYHIVPEYSIVELVRSSQVGDGFFEIVGTALNNNAMPLIRYRVGDIAETLDKACPCGRHYPVLKGIVGRTDDSIITPNGKIIGRLDHIYKGTHHLRQAQIYQPEQDRVIVRIVADEAFSERDGDIVLEKLYHRLGDGIRLEIERVPYITRTPRGKIKSVISEVAAWNDHPLIERS
ncbi:phenylacetate--CoA ligase family protein [candidate division KSB1 bacterium]|nr:phenylacetate--CoA ligase family protein [candidate division KSB1 bacterium]RQW01555.1 MAG: phenylacetate--CoA ligase family protein [candidate division KSB1 bacterium]